LFEGANGFLVGAQLEYQMLRWFSVPLRFFGEDRDFQFGRYRVYSISPGIAFRTDWQSNDRIELIYTRRFYNSAVDDNPARPLDPSVLAPYALVDGSKPFTGQVTMQADAIIRDALYFGQQGTALAPDVTLTRTGAGALRVDTHLGVGVNPATWDAGLVALQVGAGASLSGTATTATLRFASNNRVSGGVNVGALTGGASVLIMDGPNTTLYNAASVAAGATQTMTQRLAVGGTGTLTLSPDASTPALSAAGPILPSADFTQTLGSPTLRWGQAYLYQISSGPGANLFLSAPNGMSVIPGVDAQNNFGIGSNRWAAVYAVAGTIQTSSQEFKEGITPLSPERAMQAVRDTEAVTFDYVAPTRGPEWYDLPDDPEQAEALLQQRLTAAPLEAAARHQSGFVAEQCDELFLVGEGQTSPGNSVGVLIAALQHIDSRLAALEGVA
jgi:hypothetical protein